MESVEGRQRDGAGGLLVGVPHPHGGGAQVHNDRSPLRAGPAGRPARNGVGGSHARR